MYLCKGKDKNDIMCKFKFELTAGVLYREEIKRQLERSKEKLEYSGFKFY